MTIIPDPFGGSPRRLSGHQPLGPSFREHPDYYGPPDEDPPEPDCELCEDEGQVAKNFGIDSPGRPEIVPCPRCSGSKTTDEIIEADPGPEIESCGCPGPAGCGCCDACLGWADSRED